MSGEVPDGWTVKAVGEIAAVTMGQSPPSSVVNDTGDGLPFIQGNAEFGARHPTPKQFAANCPKVVEAGDILLSVRAPVGEVNIAPERLCIGRGLAGLRPTAGDHDFLYFALGGLAPTFARLSQGSTFDAINGKDLRSIPLLVPPIDEQRRIAEILRSVDEAITANRAAIDASRRTLEALAIDVVAGAPDARTVAEFGRVVTGGTPSPKNAELWNGELPFVTPGDLDDESISVRSAARTLNASSPHGARLLPVNSVLVTCIGSTVGKVAISRSECATNQQINAICCDPDLAGYVYLACFGAYDEIVANAGKQAVPIINKSTFSALTLPCFPRERMLEISKAVDAVDDERERSVAALVRLASMKTSVMSDLLSGRIRVRP
jgi:type I restriction enzyme S subunit